MCRLDMQTARISTHTNAPFFRGVLVTKKIATAIISSLIQGEQLSATGDGKCKRMFLEVVINTATGNHPI